MSSGSLPSFRSRKDGTHYPLTGRRRPHVDVTVKTSGEPWGKRRASLNLQQNAVKELEHKNSRNRKEASIEEVTENGNTYYRVRIFDDRSGITRTKKYPTYAKAKNYYDNIRFYVEWL